MLGVLAFVLGAAVGSFLNVAADRLPAGRSLVKPRSFCERCNRTLSALDLVPIASYLWLRGRCRHCGGAIPARLVLVELATAVLFTVVYLRFGLGVEALVLWAAISVLLVVVVIDLEHGLILNVIVFPSMAILLIMAPFWSELGLSRPLLGSSSMAASLYNSLVAGFGAFVLFLIITLVSPRGMGAGDVKLAGVLGLLLGLPEIVVALWIGVVSGGLAAIFLLLWRKKSRKDAIPFGPFLAVGAIVALLAGSDLVSGYQEMASRFWGIWT